MAPKKNPTQAKEQSSKKGHKDDKQTHEKKKKGSSFFSITVLSVIVLLVAQWIRVRVIFSDPIKVNHIKLNGDASLRDKIVSDRKPVVFSESLSGSALWDISTLKDEPKLSEIPLKVQKREDGKFASYDGSKPLSNYDYIKNIGGSEDAETISAGEFFTGPGLRYYEGQVSKDFSKALDHLPKGVDTNQVLILMNQKAMSKPRQTHHSTFMAVIDGKIDMIIFPPHDAFNLYPYPYLHPNFGSTQVAFEEEITPQRIYDLMFRFPRASISTPYRVRARQGDIIYIPSFWFVQITALENTAILKSHSSSYEGEIMDSLMDLEIPVFDAFDYQTIFLKKFMIELDEHFYHNTSDAMIHSLVESRYKPAYNGVHLTTTSNFTSCMYPDPEILADGTEDLIKPMEFIGKALKELESHPAIRKTIIFNLIESIISKSIDAEEAFFFFANCFYAGISNAKSVPFSE